MLQQIFSLLWLYLGNSQVSVYRTIGPNLVLFLDYLVTKVTMVIDANRFCSSIKLSYIWVLGMGWATLFYCGTP